MTNFEAIEQAIRHIIKDAPNFDLDLSIINADTALNRSNTAFATFGDINDTKAFDEWANAPYKPKSFFEAMPILSRAQMEDGILDIVKICKDRVCVDSHTVIDCLNKKYNPMPKTLPGDILFTDNGCFKGKYVKLNGNLCLNTNPNLTSGNLTVHFHAVERTLKKIQRCDGDTLKTIWEA